MTNYLLAGGGTGGHVNPLLALADFIRNEQDDSQVITLGTGEGLESRLVPLRGFELQTIERLPFPRRLNLYAIRFPSAFGRAVKQIESLIESRRIDVLVGFGGYASAPAYLAAKRAKIPFVVHEANALPGLANRLGARSASAVASAFASKKLPRAVVTGMPLRSEIERAAKSPDQVAARIKLGLQPDSTTLLVTGGSLGAKRLNDGISEAAGALHAAGIQVFHITGGHSDLPEVSTPTLTRVKFCDRMDLAIESANLAISRSGASTVCEFGIFGLPALYVPYPVGNGEQRLNVEALVVAGGAEIVDDSEFDAVFVRDRVIPLISNTKELAKMSAIVRQNSINDGTRRLYELVQSVLPENLSNGE